MKKKPVSKPSIPAPKSYNRPRRLALAQNYLKNPSLARFLIRKARLGVNDTVVEIGPGYGLITEQLAPVCKRVIAVEKDRDLVKELLGQLKKYSNVEVVGADFVRFRIAEKDYKVFSNLPFNQTSAIVKKLLFAANPPGDAFLFVQKEAAGRLSGKPVDYELSIMTKPWFDYQIVHHFDRTDFSPVPSVEVVLLHIHRREKPLLEASLFRSYADFVRYGFSGQKKNLMSNFKKIFTYEQWKRLAHDLKFPTQALVRDLSVKQWIGLFEFFLRLRQTKKPIRPK